LIRLFFIGIVLGIIVAAATLATFPVVDQEREASIISVSPNGGTVENFHINLPVDRVMSGAQEGGYAVPEGLVWPTDELLADVRTELFKLRNAREAVVGVAVRTAARRDDADVIDWLLHLPARGSLLASLEQAPREGGYRAGVIRSGSREFSTLSGALGERYVEAAENAEEAPMGRIELRASYIGQADPVEVLEVAE
jgi:hypothetical protein